MRHFLTILNHEIRMLLVNPSTYIAAVLFLAVMGFSFIIMLEGYSDGAGQEESPATIFFRYFFIPVFFIVPLLTMKCFAEERRLGTLETLLTTPVTTTEVVLGKFGSAYFLYLLLWASTGGFFYVLYQFAGDRFMDPGPLVGGYVFIAVSGLLFTALGVFASSLSRNVAVAGILSFTLLFGLIVGLNFVDSMLVMDLELMRPLKATVKYAQVFEHLDDFSRGVIDVRQVLFYVSGTILALIFSILGVEAKQLQG
ncbi:MAG TPA: ABC transporter permease subunit [Opitutaceae bacterium]|nr:ABC transporter permease subunit [Opitutaceae bacterium]